MSIVYFRSPMIIIIVIQKSGQGDDCLGEHAVTKHPDRQWYPEPIIPATRRYSAPLLLRNMMALSERGMRLTTKTIRMDQLRKW